MDKKSRFSLLNRHLDGRISTGRRSIFTYGFLIFVIFIAFSFAALQVFKSNTLENARSVSLEMATRLALRSISVFESQKQLIETTAWFTYDKIYEAKLTHQDVDFEQWLTDCRILLQRHFGQTRFDVFAAISGKIAAASYWRGDEDLNVTTRPWYKEAIANRGRAVILDPYIDVYSGHQVVTIASTIGETDDVLACDIYPELSQMTEVQNLLPSGYAFFLIDRQGSLITFAGTKSRDYRLLQDFVDENFMPALLSHGQLEGMQYADLEAHKLHVVSYRDPATGWYSILTADYDVILEGYYQVQKLFLILITAFILIECAMLFREYQLSRQIEVNNETLKVLGNSYETIVRINFRNGTFAILKAPDKVREYLKRFPESQASSYAVLMKYLTDTICPEFRASFEEDYSLNSIAHYAVNRIRDVGHDYRFELTRGQPLWYNVRVLYDESLDLAESVLSFKLADDEKMQELAEQQLLREALENSRRSELSRNSFFASVSHDMRTPLNGIIGLCSLVFARDPKSLQREELLEDFRKIDSSSKQLLSLVDDILEISRPIQDKLPQRLPFKLKESLDEVLEVFKVMAAAEHKTFTSRIDVVHNCLSGDFPLIRQVVNNLLSNSFKYSLPGAEVEFKMREIIELEGRTKFIIEISDTGIGISPDFLPHIFVPYEREGRLKNISGTGLGLVIVKSIVNRLDGDIRFTSELNKGTTVTVIIPLEIIEDKSLEVQELDKPTESGNLPLELSGLKILLAEDNDLNMEITTDMLMLRGIEVTPACDGAEALSLFNSRGENYFDAVLLDMRMPKMDGCEAAMAIRALNTSYAREVPLIAVTANAFAEDIAATTAAGMNAHVSKPIDFKILENTLDKLVKRRLASS